MDEICSQTINILINEFEKNENQNEIKQRVLNPIIKYIGKELWPYFMISSIFLITLIIILIVIIYILFRIKKTNLQTKMLID